jgi:hypothetical protein
MALEIFKGEDSIILRDNTATTFVYFEFTIIRLPGEPPKIKVVSSGGTAGVSTLFMGGRLDADTLQEILSFLNTPVLAMADTYGVD